MSNEEAIKELNGFVETINEMINEMNKSCVYLLESRKRKLEALNLAIKALEDQTDDLK